MESCGLSLGMFSFGKGLNRGSYCKAELESGLTEAVMGGA